jgi:hypothetical protein
MHFCPDPYRLRQMLAPIDGVTLPAPAGGEYWQIMVDIDPIKPSKTCRTSPEGDPPELLDDGDPAIPWGLAVSRDLRRGRRFRTTDAVCLDDAVRRC